MSAFWNGVLRSNNYTGNTKNLCVSVLQKWDVKLRVEIHTEWVIHTWASSFGALMADEVTLPVLLESLQVYISAIKTLFVPWLIHTFFFQSTERSVINITLVPAAGCFLWWSLASLWENGEKSGSVHDMKQNGFCFEKPDYLFRKSILWKCWKIWKLEKNL